MDYQTGDFVEIYYRANKHICRGQVLDAGPYQITILVYYSSSQTMQGHIGHELRINLDTRDEPYIIVTKWETKLTEEDVLDLMHVALHVHDKAWFDELGERKNQKMYFYH